MGVNTWLMKGFFDTIPKELDESARVDGATPAQIFWGVILPLAAPVLAVIALISFIATLNEFVIASVILADDGQQFTLPVGLWQFIDQKYSEHWGPFAAGVAARRDPGGAPVRLPPALHRGGTDRGLGEGMSATVARRSTLLDQPHHDGSDSTSSSGRPSSAARRSSASHVPQRRRRSSRCARSRTARRACGRGESTRATAGGRRASRCRTRSCATAGCSPAATSATRG